MTDDDKPASQSRPVETTEGAMDEYKAGQKAGRAPRWPSFASCG